MSADPAGIIKLLGDINAVCAERGLNDDDLVEQFGITEMSA